MCKEFHEKNVFFTSEKFLDLKMMLKQLPLKLPIYNELAFRGANSYSNILIDTRAQLCSERVLRVRVQ